MSNFAFCTIFEHALVFENRLEQVQGLAHGDLRDRVAAEIEPVGGAVRQRHIGRVSRHDRERHADQLALHRIGGIELHPEGEMALIARGLEQVGEPRRVGHGLVIGPVEGDGFEPCRALDRELRRGVPPSVLRCGGAAAPRGRAPQRVIVIVLLLPLRRG